MADTTKMQSLDMKEFKDYCSLRMRASYSDEKETKAELKKLSKTKEKDWKELKSKYMD